MMMLKQLAPNKVKKTSAKAGPSSADAKHETILGEQLCSLLCCKLKLAMLATRTSSRRHTIQPF